MPKQLNVNLAFTADTNKAKQGLMDLQRQLNALTVRSAQKSSLGLTEEISQAIVDVTKLEVALKNATSQTGTLDLGQFRQELNKSGLTVDKIANQLLNLGPEGKMAFAQLAQSITMAEVPLKKTSTLLTNFATTLKNTARWQISNSILHGFMGSLQKAYGYAEDLNESLNDIRIVTGQSADQMADFAKEANKAAKELSTTTTAYTDAALIFYQQGLTGDDVTERTDTVIKMANVTGQSAEEVSSYMTAIWNNFYDGSTSLEHFADVITNLGAHTASSSREIAEGLEKFAAVGQTVGLTYDYATAALATVVAQTRQSADVVGNAFKTLFARIQGLKLGETLDDGTDLTKYSKALAAVGIQIKDQQGELKDMNTILDEMGAKWQQLAKDEQVALAQTVAGVRQYTQLIALMDNWDKFQDNLGFAENSTGSLQKQADIYAESWEAAQKRVQAAAQEIYSQLLDDKFFISLTDGFAKFLDGISNVIDALGGLKGVIPVLGLALTKMFGADLSKSIDNAIYNIKLMSTSGREEIFKMRSGFITAMKDMADEATNIGGAQSQVYSGLAKVQEELLRKTIDLESANRNLSETEQTQINKLLDQNNLLGEQYLQLAKNRDEQEAITEQLIAQTRAKINAANTKQKDPDKRYIDFDFDVRNAQILQKQFMIGTNLVRDFNIELANVKNGSSSLESVNEAASLLLENFEKAGVDIQEFDTYLAAIGDAESVPALEQAIENLRKKITELGQQAQTSFNDISNSMREAGVSAAETRNAVNGLQEGATNLAQTEGGLVSIQGSFSRSLDKTSDAIKEILGK